MANAIAGKDIMFQMNVTALNQNFQTKVWAKLTAFNTDSDLIRDVVGASALYLQNNKSCSLVPF